MPAERTIMKRELVLDAIAHKETWCIPHMIGYQPSVGRALADYYGVEDIDPILGDAVEWIGDRLPASRLEALGLLRDGEYTDDWDVRWFGVGETRGQVKRPPLGKPSLQGYQFPEALSPAIMEQMKGQCVASPNRYRVAKLGALWEQATFLRGMEELLVDLILHPHFVHELLDGITEFLLGNLERYSHELDIDCIWLSDDYGSQASLLMSPELWHQFIEPRLWRICEAVHQHGYHFALHSDGAISDVISGLAEIGVDLLHPVQSECVDALWVKREFGRHLTIWGGYGNQGTLVFGTPEQVRREVHQTCDALAVGGGFILSPGLGLQIETPLGNAAAFVETAREREIGCRPNSEVPRID
jgi:uroporphyrinogen decarboxylase